MMKDASPPLCKAASGDNDAVPPTDDEGAAVVSFLALTVMSKCMLTSSQPRLPTTKVNGDSKRSPIAILFLLQVLSLVPAIVGCSTCWKNALSATTSGYSTRLDWAISSFWVRALLSRAQRPPNDSPNRPSRPATQATPWPPVFSDAGSSSTILYPP